MMTRLFHSYSYWTQTMSYITRGLTDWQTQHYSWNDEPTLIIQILYKGIPRTNINCKKRTSMKVECSKLFSFCARRTIPKFPKRIQKRLRFWRRLRFKFFDGFRFFFTSGSGRLCKAGKNKGNFVQWWQYWLSLRHVVRQQVL